MGTSNSGSNTPSTRKAILRLVFQLVLVGGGIAVAYHFFDFEKIRVALENLSFSTIFIFVALMLLIRVVNAWRWLIICKDCLKLKGYSLGFILRVSLLVEFVNVWFPSFIGGEAVKVWKLAKKTKMDKKIPISVVLDRIVGVGSLALVCLPFVLLFPRYLPEMELTTGSMWLWGAIGAAVITAGGITYWKRTKVFRLARQSVDFFLEHNFLVTPTLVSILGYPIMIAAYWVLFEAIAPQNLLEVSILTLIPRFGRIFPVSALGIGAVEGSTIFLGEYLGVGAQVMLVVVAMHVSSKYLASLLGIGLEILFNGTRTIRELVQDTEKVEQFEKGVASDADEELSTSERSDVHEEPSSN